MDKAPENVIRQAQPGPQTLLIKAGNIFDVFFGGARGGGKSDGMLGEWISHAGKYGKHARGIFIRRSRQELEHLLRRAQQIYRPLGAIWLESKKFFTFPGGATLEFAYLNNDKDAGRYMGREYTRVYIEELTNFPNPEPVYKMMACLRSPAGVPCGFRATGNPGGPGHTWVKERYIAHSPPMKVTKQEFENPLNGKSMVTERVFIPSKLQNNKYLGDEYVKSLMNLQSPTLVKAWLEGDWSIIEGAFFPEFSMSKHVIAPIQIPAHWTRFRAMDPGHAQPFSIGWYTVVPEETLWPRHIQASWMVSPEPLANGPRRVPQGDTIMIPKGAIIKYREWYGIAFAKDGRYLPNKGLRLDNEKVADGIIMREMEEPRDVEGRIGIAYGVIDPSANAQHGGPSIMEVMNNRLVRARTTPFHKADNTRIPKKGAISGNDQIRARLVGDTVRPMVYFFETCIHIIRTLPSLPHDLTNPEDSDTTAEDHAVDELRYACMSRPYIRSDVYSPDKRKRTLSEATLDELWDDNDAKRKATSSQRIN